MEREKGQTVAAEACPNCGSARTLVAQPDGSMATSTCSACYGTVAAKEVAAAAVSVLPAREVGTTEGELS